MDSEYKPTFFDSQLQTHQLQIMKTMIPYLSAGQQRPFALLIKYMELQKLTLDNDTFENTGKSRFFERRTSRVLY